MIQKLNRVEAKAVQEAVKHGFTFAGDSIFATYNSAMRCLKSLVRNGYLLKVEAGEGVQYVPTDAARDYVKYGILAGEVA